MLGIREVDRASDRAGVEAIDTRFTTDRIFEVVVEPRRIELIERVLPTPRVKRYPIADVFAHWSTWDVGWVAEDDGRIVGFAAVEYAAWHRRLILWHLYVQPTHRRSGVARALLDRAEAHGRALGARRVWLETSNVNVPGIAAYARLGYTLCGADVHYYEGTATASEQAIYLAKPL